MPRKNAAFAALQKLKEIKVPLMKDNLSYRVDNAETARVKNFALEILRADLVGVANIERFKEAPVKMSPGGVMPSARSVVVMAIHHPDASIELGGKNHPQDIGPYEIQYHMNWRLDDMSYRMSNFLEDAGYNAVPIASSNIWRYRGYKDLTEQFAPDVSHLHAAVAAGLAEYGYSGLAVTPEFGARVRYVTIVTDAELTPSPLLEPGSVCDSCMICRKECRSGALSKELKGWNVITLEGKEYRYANKNLWRCSWGEHFDIDLDIPLPEVVDEKVIREASIKYGRRGGEMGSCLRYCLPKGLRYWDRDYTNAPRRRRQFVPNPELAGEAFHRGLFERIRAAGAAWGADGAVVSDAAELAGRLGVDIAALMPGAVRAVSFYVARRRAPERRDFIPILTQSGYDATRALENCGYAACQFLKFPEEEFAAALEAPEGTRVMALTLLTDAPLPLTGWTLPSPRVRISGGVGAGSGAGASAAASAAGAAAASPSAPPPPPSPAALTARVNTELAAFGCDIWGVAPARRLDEIVPALREIFEDETELVCRNTATSIYQPYAPEIKAVPRKIHGAADRLPGAKSVLVIGLRLPRKTVDITARTPAEAAGPYVFAQYETSWRLNIIAQNIAGLLERAGHSAAIVNDLHGAGGVCMNPRGEQPDAFSNVFAAAGAGLGRISLCGALVTPRFGSCVRTLSIVTDAPLTPDPVMRGDAEVELACADCAQTCISACATSAFQPATHTFELDGVPQTFRRVDINRCNWAKRYSLVASEGSQYTGWRLDLPFPADFGETALAEAVAQLPQIEKVRPCNFEQCVLACPHARPQ